MSKPKDDGGVAFPVSRDANYDSHWSASPGMSLRDWFAGQALAGICAHHDPGDAVNGFAEGAYSLADAMLEARKS